ncbi:hypothetical protein, partial [Citrobacter sp. wls710]|uniref:hypothetical protein n=1 Tax=Citrobacter sp. wls710 TaxID=2576426 RepID=UPI001BAEC4AB
GVWKYRGKSTKDGGVQKGYLSYVTALIGVSRDTPSLLAYLFFLVLISHFDANRQSVISLVQLIWF